MKQNIANQKKIVRDMNFGLIYKFFQSAEYQKGTNNHQGRSETNRKRIWYEIAQ